jgi:hypothetical protein
MNKEKFLEVASQLFDQTNPIANENLIPLDKGIWEELVDQIGSEIFDEGMDLVSDYELEMCSHEVTLENVRLNIRVIERAVSDVLSRYFVIK